LLALPRTDQAIGVRGASSRHTRQPSDHRRSTPEGTRLLTETEASIKAKLRRGTFTTTFLLATLAALEMEGFRLADL
jgi:hypothetical protein